MISIDNQRSTSATSRYLLYVIPPGTPEISSAFVKNTFGIERPHCMWGVLMVTTDTLGALTSKVQPELNKINPLIDSAIIESSSSVSVAPAPAPTPTLGGGAFLILVKL